MKLEVGYKTGSGNLMSITVHGRFFYRSDIPVSTPGLYCNNSGVECGGYNGGCPPYAPRFNNIKKSQQYFYIICVEFDMEWAMKYAGRPTPYFMLSYADRLTMSYIQRAVQHFEKIGYYTLGASNCPGCSPKNCTVTRGGKCSKPKKRRFSLEATGVDCGLLHKSMFGEALPWWYRTPNHIPARMYRYAGVFVSDLELFNDFDDSYMDEDLDDFVYNDKSYHDTIPEHGYHRLHEWTIPKGKADQGTYIGYYIR